MPNIHKATASNMLSQVEQLSTSGNMVPLNSKVTIEMDWHVIIFNKCRQVFLKKKATGDDVHSDVKWSTAKVSKLIELVEGHPCLYNTKDPSYHDRDMRLKTTMEIATALEIPDILLFLFFLLLLAKIMYNTTAAAAKVRAAILFIKLNYLATSCYSVCWLAITNLLLATF